MPIYEYMCSQCGTRFERLVRQIANAGDATPACPDCSSNDTQRVMSTFAQHGEAGVDREAVRAENAHAEHLASITPKEQIDSWRSGQDKNS